MELGEVLHLRKTNYLFLSKGLEYFKPFFMFKDMYQAVYYSYKQRKCFLRDDKKGWFDFEYYPTYYKIDPDGEYETLDGLRANPVNKCDKSKPLEYYEIDIPMEIRVLIDLYLNEDEKESMKRQFVWLNEVLNYLPVTTMIYDGVEADDVMAYVTTHLLKEDEQAVVMSTDKDFLQLVDDKTIVWSPTKKKIYNKKAVREEYGIESENILLYRILDGDSSDNIPGVYGCGIKTLIKRFPEITEQKELSVEDLFHLCETKKVETKGKIKLYNDILEAKDQILMNQKLMQLKDVDISGVIKMQVLDRFNQEIKPLNKIDFLKILLKYKVVNNFGDINDWTKGTFGNFITD